jgi:hypothetical protein
MLPLGAAQRLKDFDGPAARRQRPASTPTSRLLLVVYISDATAIFVRCKGVGDATLQNPRHEAFAQELAKGSTADRPMKSRATSAGHASRQPANGNVCNRVAELRAVGAERAVVTVERLILRKQVRVAAMENPAAVSAITAKAKLAGLWLEKRENLNTIDPNQLTDAQLTELIDRPPPATYEERDARRTRLANRRTDEAA